jgi:hypothetical protein
LFEAKPEGAKVTEIHDFEIRAGGGPV